MLLPRLFRLPWPSPTQLRASLPQPNWLLLGLTALALGFSGCRGESSRAFHLLIISVGELDDADLQSVDPKRHPNLHAWLQTSTRFRAVQTERSDGLSTTASQLTGLRAEEHGAGQVLVDGEVTWTQLAPEQTPMAEYFIEHGYNPGAVVGGEPFYDPAFGLNQGFREYESIPANAEATALLGVDWIDSHIKQPFFCFIGLRSDPEGDLDARLTELDRAVGHLLGALARHGVLESALVILTANRPRNAGSTLPLLVKAPRQTTAAQDLREVYPYHLPQLILQHATLPVAAVRPNSYLKHPLPDPLPDLTPSNGDSENSDSNHE